MSPHRGLSPNVLDIFGTKNANNLKQENITFQLYSIKFKSIISSRIMFFFLKKKNFHRKRWQIYGVNEETGMTELAVIVMNIIPTWNKPELIIPKAFLNYGYFKLVYTLTMHGKPRCKIFIVIGL